MAAPSLLSKSSLQCWWQMFWGGFCDGLIVRPAFHLYGKQPSGYRPTETVRLKNAQRAVRFPRELSKDGDTTAKSQRPNGVIITRYCSSKAPRADNSRLTDHCGRCELATATWVQRCVHFFPRTSYDISLVFPCGRVHIIFMLSEEKNVLLHAAHNCVFRANWKSLCAYNKKLQISNFSFVVFHQSDTLKLLLILNKYKFTVRADKTLAVRQPKTQRWGGVPCLWMFMTPHGCNFCGLVTVAIWWTAFFYRTSKYYQRCWGDEQGCFAAHVYIIN